MTFHVEHLGETTIASSPDRFESGLLLGILVGSAHFGGDGRQPQITLKMHVRHERLLRRLLALVPTGRLYGPYFHSGRQYFQLMYRGESLRRDLVPLLDALPWQQIDAYSYERYRAMKERYAIS